MFTCVDCGNAFDSMGLYTDVCHDCNKDYSNSLTRERRVKSLPIITFCNGWISIRRGKRLRKYTPGFLSYKRLSDLMFDGPVDYHDPTVRSFKYTWRGLSTLTHEQQIMLYRFHELIDIYHAHDNNSNLNYLLGYRKACEDSGIHERLTGIC